MNKYVGSHEIEATLNSLFFLNSAKFDKSYFEKKTLSLSSNYNGSRCCLCNLIIMRADQKFFAVAQEKQMTSLYFLKFEIRHIIRRIAKKTKA
jgi:hypothetical protein